MPKKEVSFVAVVKDMVEQGHDLPAIAETLVALGLGKDDAEKLVLIMEEKGLPRVRGTVNYLVKKKVISKEEALQLKLSRHSLSKKRAAANEWRSAKKNIAALVEEFFPEKQATFKRRWQKLEATRIMEKDLRKDMQAFLLELDTEGLPLRTKSKLKKAIGFFS